MARLPLLAALAAASTAAPAPPAGFVAVNGSQFALDGKPWVYAGSNNYYIPYSSQYMADEVFERAVAQNFTALRTWPFGTGRVCGDPADAGTLLFQCWDNATQSVRINTTAFDVQLDYMVAKARESGVRLVMTLTNNWKDFGGLEMYVYWRQLHAAHIGEPFTPYHDSFYTDPVIRGWYQDYVEAMIGHVNTLTGVAYRDEPAILAWQLGNELRCVGSSGGYNTSAGCIVNGSSPLMLAWVDEMSRFIHSLDPNHLVSVGDEGFYCNGGRFPVDCPPNQWWCNCATGDDTLGFAALPGIDYATFHMYPLAWGEGGMGALFAPELMANHSFEARTYLRKPVVMEEFGLGVFDNKTAHAQSDAYANWTAYAQDVGVTGWGVWMLIGRTSFTPDRPWYPNGDGLELYCNRTGDPLPPASADERSCGILRAAALSLAASAGAN